MLQLQIINRNRVVQHIGAQVPTAQSLSCRFEFPFSHAYIDLVLLLFSRYHADRGEYELNYAARGTNDPERSKEMEKQFVDLLNEELKLQQIVAEEHSHHMNATLVEAKRQATQYQREAEKCNTATETCEEAREKSEGALSKEKKLTALWERRARQLGWQDSRATAI